MRRRKKKRSQKGRTKNIYCNGNRAKFLLTEGPHLIKSQPLKLSTLTK